MEQQARRVRFRCRCGRMVSTDEHSPAALTQRCTRCEVRHGDLAHHRQVLHRERRRAS